MDLVLPQVEREDKVFDVVISPFDLMVSKSGIINSLGYLHDKIPAHFEEMIDTVISQVPENCVIKAGYRLVQIEKSTDRDDGLYIGKKFFKMQKIVTSQLRKAEQAALFICTIGSKMENWTRQLSAAGNIVLGYIVDAVASEVVECAADLLHNHIGMYVRKHGLDVTNRYSPGYCDWSVAEQHLLFSLLPENFCGVSLMQSALMVPIKSISGIIGVGKNVKRRDYICDKCGIKDCTYRAYRLAKKQTYMKQQK